MTVDPTEPPKKENSSIGDGPLIAHPPQEPRPVVSRQQNHPPPPPRKDSMPNRSDATAATATNTACTSPLTVTSLEVAAAGTAGTAVGSSTKNPPGGLRNAGGGGGRGRRGGSAVGGGGVPQVVSSMTVVHQLQRQQQPAPHDHHLLAAQSAMAGLGIEDYGPTYHYSEDRFKTRNRTPPTEHDNRKLFVGGLPTDVTGIGFFNFFNQFGTVVDSVVMVDRVTKRSRGFGFVTFANENDAAGLLTAIPGKTGYVYINGKQCEVKASTPKTDNGPVPRQQHRQGGPWRSNYTPHRDSNDRGYSNPQRSGGVDAGGVGMQVVANDATSSPISGLDGAQRPPSPATTSIYKPPMNPYGRIYNPNYPPLYPAAGASNGYIYPGGTTPYNAPYATMGQVRGNNGGYYNPYPYGQYGNVGYATHNVYNADGGSLGAPLPPMQGEVEYSLGYYDFIPQQPYRDLSSDDSST